MEEKRTVYIKLNSFVLLGVLGCVVLEGWIRLHNHSDGAATTVTAFTSILRFRAHAQ